MDQVTRYNEIAKTVITEIFERFAKSEGEVLYQLIMDEKSRNYILLTDGWIDESRFYGILIHIQVKEDGRVWLHDDNTDLIVVDWLLERGIPKKDMVLGWHTPSMRPDTEFATT